MTTSALTPRQPVPALSVPLVDGQRFVLGEKPGQRFDLIVAYRGLHCPICAKYLMELERLVPEFQGRGVEVLADQPEMWRVVHPARRGYGWQKVDIARRGPSSCQLPARQLSGRLYLR